MEKCTRIIYLLRGLCLVNTPEVKRTSTKLLDLVLVYIHVCECKILVPGEVWDDLCEQVVFKGSCSSEGELLHP